MKKKTIVILGIVAILFIWINSFIQGDTSNTISYHVTEFLVNTFHLEFDFQSVHVFIRKAAHVLEYMGLGAILYLLVESRGYKYAPFYAFVLSLLVACMDEMIQYFNIDRLGQLSDVVLDGVGILLGIGVIWGIKKVRARTNK